MEISAIKELMAQFDGSSLREFSYKNAGDELVFSKNEQTVLQPQVVSTPSQPVALETAVAPAETVAPVQEETATPALSAEGEAVESPLVGVAYLSPAPDKPAFVQVGDQVKKGQTLLIIEAMKVMNEVPAPKDGQVTEILVANEAVVEFGQGLVRIK